MPARRILVTSGLPYANGPIHIGHLVEYIQTDIWVRFQKLVGNRCVYFCGDDTHGTATMIRARQEGRFVIYTADYAAMNELLGFLTEKCCQGSACQPARQRNAA